MLYFAAEGGDAHNPILPIWQEIVVGTVAFAILCFVLMKFVFPRMEQTFQARVEAIEGGIKRAEVAQAEANQLLEQYRAQLAEARTDAAKIRDDARADADGTASAGRGGGEGGAPALSSGVADDPHRP
jgi:F-type H+-transporting ATPase subunit b